MHQQINVLEHQVSTFMTWWPVKFSVINLFVLKYTNLYFCNFLDVLHLLSLYNLQLLEALDWKLMNEKDPVNKVCLYNL